MSTISLVRCKNYEYDRIETALRHAVGLLGGIEQFVSRDQRVVIKPNLLSAQPPEDCITTHPELMRAVIRLIKPLARQIRIADSPGGWTWTAANLKEVYEKTGMEAMAREEGIELVTKTTVRNKDGIAVADWALDAGAIISVPKLKTHTLTFLTCAIKNIFGIVPGMHKMEVHKKFIHVRDMSRELARIHAIRPPALTIVDGIMGLEGDGPGSAGTPKHIGIILAGRDCVAIDAVVSRIMGFQPQAIPLITEAYRMKLGEMRQERIEIKGETPEAVKPEHFILPKTALYAKIPNWIIAPFAKLLEVRPVISQQRCEQCMICANSCPVKAITISEEYCGIDYEKCMHCFCCHELCPYHAIDIRESWLVKLLMR